VIAETLIEIDNRRPFEPYSIRLNDGSVLKIDEPEHCLVTRDGQTLVFNDAGGKLKFISIRNITLVE
jgi:hypothetical protein